MSYGLEDFDFDDDISTLRMDSTFNESLIFYPMPDDISHYKLHRYEKYYGVSWFRSGFLGAGPGYMYLHPCRPSCLRDKLPQVGYK